ncbi:hypothetical protein TNCV_4604791 [Trichonephila clavipes]|nr:hypothetical protein TNCV_4604791 [Trichonephila clavipes]
MLTVRVSLLNCFEAFRGEAGTKTWSFVNSGLHNFPIWESVPEPNEMGHVIEEIVDLDRQINLQVESDEDRELLDSHNQELTIDELIKVHERDQDIEKL